MEIRTEDRTYVESSRDGALMVELDRKGNVVRVQLEPEVNADWTAEVLGDRVVRLYRVALMRARCDERIRCNERGADMPPDELHPSEAQIAEYRARYIDF